jgi:hypothetical protein
MMRLLRDITAADLGMDRPEDADEGYPSDYVIGPAGSFVTPVGRFRDMIEVTDFDNDPSAFGAIPLDAVEH